MFSETRYAMNAGLRVAYRASSEGTRDIVVVPNWFTNCEVVPELLPSMQGWTEAMTSLGRVVYFDQPGSGASDPVTPGALPTLEQWADSITAVLDDLAIRDAVLVAGPGALPTAALFAATYPSRTTALIVLEGYSDPRSERPDGLDPAETRLRWSRCGAPVSCSTFKIRTCLGTRRFGQRGLEWSAWRSVRAA